MFEIMEQRLYTAVCCDVMDDLGYRNQAMHHNIRPLDDNVKVIGRAKTILAVDVYEVTKDCYKVEIEALDSVKEGEVVVVSTNNSLTNGIWGELLSTAAKARGARGAIIDGLGRDIEKIREMKFPVFMVGFKPVDSKGRGLVIDYDCPINCGGVIVEPGDIVFGDYDGVIAIPHRICHEVIERSLHKVEKEQSTKNALLKGKLLKDVYDQFGVL
ncbi:MAG TPA: RraA family protein [Clostridiaceae bacterium]|nr:RraA family protein [Clostridiaceae bacterium]